MKFSTHTLGCKVNLYESEAVINDLVSRGFEYGNFNDVCDVYIINTCTVTSTSDAKSRKVIRQAIRRNPKAIIVVMGCYAQLNPNEVVSLEGVDIIIGTKNRNRVYDLIMERINSKQTINLVTDVFKYKEYEEIKVNRFSRHTRGFIKIQDGCENFCSYCAIPYARGGIKSRRAKDVIDEIKQMVASGVKEVVLAGINTGTYGQDTKEDNLASLIDKLLTEVPELYRIRLSSIELMEVTDELLTTIEKYQDKVAMHLHIPLQGGSDPTLERMNRRYTTSEYAKRIDDIRKIFPRIAITTDCLGGFVGETEEDFENSLSFIETMQFSEMHVFPYSRRKNTRADRMDGHLPEAVKKERTHKLIELGHKMAQVYREQFRGEEFEVIVEDKKDNLWRAHTSNYIEVEFEADNIKENDIVRIRLDEPNYPVSKATFLRKE
ncbi:MAG: tRNA (N(6)-L-threonylcarbamoyladenosine(37)-C(2))-methylthiotransferase MtaB [Bacilli bacterium]|jgi:threonylcarbamoyladenosine tRNA methylthiotransferase MtaB